MQNREYTVNAGGGSGGLKYFAGGSKVPEFYVHLKVWIFKNWRVCATEGSGSPQFRLVKK